MISTGEATGSFVRDNREYSAIASKTQAKGWSPQQALQAPQSDKNGSWAKICGIKRSRSKSVSEDVASRI